MKIFFRTKKLEKICNNCKVMRKELGASMSTKLKQRLAELNAATTLEDISHLPPPRLHELKGRRKEQFSVDLEHPYRLLFIVANNIIPKNTSGGIDKSKTTEIEIIEIIDTH